jgi:hypothetical protein
MYKNKNVTKVRILTRSLIKKKSISLIVITGFSVSISIVLVLIAFLIRDTLTWIIFTGYLLTAI